VPKQRHDDTCGGMQHKTQFDLSVQIQHAGQFLRSYYHNSSAHNLTRHQTLTQYSCIRRRHNCLTNICNRGGRSRVEGGTDGRNVCGGRGRDAAVGHVGAMDSAIGTLVGNLLKNTEHPAHTRALSAATITTRLLNSHPVKNSQPHSAQ